MPRPLPAVALGALLAATTAAAPPGGASAGAAGASPAPSGRLAAATAAADLLVPERKAPDDQAIERGRQLQQAIDEIVARTPLHAARASILVSALETGQVLYAHDPDALLNPASNVKLFTTAAALARLGPEYRFETEIYADAAPAAGVVRTLYVKGKGDPTFVTERVWALAGQIAHGGLKAVKGDLLVDDTFFDGEREGPGYDQEHGDRSYLAPAGALSLNFNTVAIHVAPGARTGDKARVELEPACDYLELDNRTRTVKARARRRLAPASIQLPSGRQRIVVEGRIPAGSRDQVFYRKIDDPAAYFGATLKRLLELRGVKVSGQVRRAPVAAGARLLAVSESEALGEVVRKLQKTSNNFIAEQLLKTLGAEKKGAPGTWPKGVEAVEDFLAEAGIARGSYVMRNGSGLNDTNRFSARQAVTLLREMWRRFPLMADFLAALPVAGKDGTTRWRMESTEGRLRAKTGTLEGVTSLSGYVETAAHDRLVFSILVNDFPGRAHLTVRAVDAVGSALAAAGRPADVGAAIASAVPPPRADEAAALVKAHLATYYQLGRSGDPRNAAFLRTSLKTERDPVLRMAAGEAIYLSDPDSESARRAFLDAVAAEGTSFARLRELGGAELEEPSPILASLAELAGEGREDAVARLVELSPAALADPALGGRLAELWEEVSRDAPDEVIAALCAASATASDAAIAAIARGVAASPDGEHPFLSALRHGPEEDDPEQAAHARALAPRVERALAASRAVLQAGPATTIGPASPSGTPRKEPASQDGH